MRAHYARAWCYKVLLAGSLAVAVLVFGRADSAHATTALWNVYPGVVTSGIYDYGWHFDETNTPQFGARDLSYAGAGSSTNAVFSAKLTATSTYPLRWRFDTVSKSCTTIVIMQVLFFGSWLDVSGTEMHYLHLADRPANGTVTNTVQSNGNSVFAFVGHLSQCATTQYHLHESADLSTSSKVLRNWYTADTCWSDNAGSYTYQCPGGNFRLDNQNATCPPGAALFQLGAVSGPISRYQCETWSQQSRDYTLRTFNGYWP